MIPRTLLLFSLLAVAGPAKAGPKDRVQLVVIATVDQMGTTYLSRWGSLLTQGIGRLKKRGAYFPAMRFEYANTETAPGHATIATGTWPNVHGMIANYWFDPTGKRINCVDDPEYGRSPEHLRAPSLADALSLATSGKSRTVSIALKDRAAILLAGDAPQAAVWFDRTQGKFVSGTWRHGASEPRWVTAVNEQKGAAKSFGVVWDRLRPELDYTALAGIDDDPNETDAPGLGRTFPKTLGRGLKAPGPEYYEYYNATPHALEALIELAKRAVVEEQLGKHNTIDLLTVGISNLDYTGHFYGPRSQEALDMVLRIDRALGELFESIEREVGSGAVLFVLTADHGVADMPEDAAEAGVAAKRIDPRKWVAAVDEALAKVDPKSPAKVKVLDLNAPRLYLSYPPGITDRLPYQRAAAAALRARPELLDARPISEVGAMVEPFGTLFQRSSAIGRDPDVMFLQRAHDVIDYVIGDAPRGFGTGHGTPYLYDMSVPVIIAGPGVSKKEDHTPYPMTRLAPTIAALVGIDPPAAAFEQPLLENQP